MGWQRNHIYLCQNGFCLITKWQTEQSLWNAQPTSLPNLFMVLIKSSKSGMNLLFWTFFMWPILKYTARYLLYEFIIVQKILDLFTFRPIRRHYWESERWNSKSATLKSLSFFGKIFHHTFNFSCNKHKIPPYWFIDLHT